MESYVPYNMSANKDCRVSNVLRVVTTTQKPAVVIGKSILDSPTEYSPASVVFNVSSIVADSKKNTKWKSVKIIGTTVNV